jgi:hypothetical protein
MCAVPRGSELWREKTELRFPFTSRTGIASNIHPEMGDSKPRNFTVAMGSPPAFRILAWSSD